ncbi:hypothetical protein MCAP1_000777 [Malassezia caprae]|uniref:Uncharacterized protein n=1 Tax=Malassezia caprae TaxID=1381934 RepID=A0AAF0E6V5_9BASI|nr:hypothetical protein MCAP1_000777 [Malassezia caprae]
MQQTQLSFEKEGDSSSESPGRARVPRIRLKRQAASMPVLPVMYDGPLPPANVAARLYLYDYVAFLDDAEALDVPPRCLDAVHAWDDAIVSAILVRLMVPLAHLATLEHGAPTSRTADAIRALRKHGAMAPASWAAAQALAAQYPVAPCELAEVDIGIAPWSAPPARDVPADLGPRRTRSTARLEAAVAALNESEAVDEDDTHVRRSRRASERAARQREEEVRARARHVLGRTREPTPDDTEPLHLEAKIACLVQLCDALSITTTKSAPFESPLHGLVQAVLDRAGPEERAAQRQTQSTEAACDAEMRACQRRAPSMASPRYAAWKQEKQALKQAHAAQRLAAAVKEHVQVRRLTPRSGPLGRDAHGHEYWHLLPVVRDADVGAEVPGVHAPFSGHWSQALVVRGAGVPLRRS